MCAKYNANKLFLFFFFFFQILFSLYKVKNDRTLMEYTYSIKVLSFFTLYKIQGTLKNKQKQNNIYIQLKCGHSLPFVCFFLFSFMKAGSGVRFRFIYYIHFYSLSSCADLNHLTWVGPGSTAVPETWQALRISTSVRGACVCTWVT